MASIAPRHVARSIGSTQAEAIALVRAGLGEEGLSVVALRQELGEGQHGRRWASPPGGLYLSIVARDPGVVPGLVPVGIGAALADGIEARFGVATRVKWPNDVYAGPSEGPFRKLAGILVDRVSARPLGDAFVVGVGVNVATDRDELPEEVGASAAILRELLEGPVGPDDVEPIAREAVVGTIARLGRPDRRAHVVARCRARLLGVGGPVRVDGEPAGTLRSIADDGALLVALDGELRAVRAGEVTLEGAA